MYWATFTQNEFGHAWFEQTGSLSRHCGSSPVNEELPAFDETDGLVLPPKDMKVTLVFSSG